jgi:hypothetical protein
MSIDVNFKLKPGCSVHSASMPPPSPRKPLGDVTVRHGAAANAKQAETTVASANVFKHAIAAKPYGTFAPPVVKPGIVVTVVLPTTTPSLMPAQSEQSLLPLARSKASEHQAIAKALYPLSTDPVFFNNLPLQGDVDILATRGEQEWGKKNYEIALEAFLLALDVQDKQKKSAAGEVPSNNWNELNLLKRIVNIYLIIEEPAASALYVERMLKLEAHPFEKYANLALFYLECGVVEFADKLYEFSDLHKSDGSKLLYFV